MSTKYLIKALKINLGKVKIISGNKRRELKSSNCFLVIYKLCILSCQKITTIRFYIKEFLVRDLNLMERRVRPEFLAVGEGRYRLQQMFSQASL